ncbi:MAG: peptidylprolyl isomerase [Parcubacteria group bacterium Gr01-1014_49]|nr:MAG: peptidylprolyl isomerase [Parcubacteria group bacterium Gr01-1014_49]
MKPTQTAIAITLALVVVVLFFIVPGLSPFGASAPGESASPVTIDTTQTTSTTMPAAPVTELQVSDEIVGTGAAAAAGDSVTVNYIGALTDGSVFDASANHGTTGFTFNLGAGQVIKGWDQGIVGMKEGGKRMLVIPASLAYGNQAVGDIIPANSTLIFEVELLKVQKAAR